MLSVFGLEGCTDRVRRRCRAGRTYVDVLRSAIAFSIVISAVLNRAIDALDVLVATSLSSTIVHLNDHPFKIGKIFSRLTKAEKGFPTESSALCRHIYYARLKSDNYNYSRG